MTTLSQLVDDIVRETRRPDMLRDIVDYANQTIRECHFDPRNNAAVMLRENFNETVVTAISDSQCQWLVPDPGTFQSMQVVKYLSYNECYPPEKVPSRGLKGLIHYYYRVGGTYIFAGFGGANAQIAIGWYEYPRRLVYYAKAQRPAEYTPDFGWEYNPAFAASEQLRLSGQGFTSNWLLLRWTDTIKEGVRAKVYKRVSDTERGRTSFSLYTSMRAQLISSESADLGGYA